MSSTASGALAWPRTVRRQSVNPCAWCCPGCPAVKHHVNRVWDGTDARLEGAIRDMARNRQCCLRLRWQCGREPTKLATIAVLEESGVWSLKQRSNQGPYGRGDGVSDLTLNGGSRAMKFKVVWIPKESLQL